MVKSKEIKDGEKIDKDPKADKIDKHSPSYLYKLTGIHHDKMTISHPHEVSMITNTEQVETISQYNRGWSCGDRHRVSPCVWKEEWWKGQ